MPTLPEKRSLRIILLLATLFVVFGYAWLGSKAFEPKLHLPGEIVAGAVYVEKGDAQPWATAFAAHGLELTRLSKELDSLRSFFGVIGGLKTPVVLIVTADDPLRYQITDNRVELGADIADADGQMAKALFKTWVLQRARPPVASSLLRTEVVSDILLALWNGGFGLSVPGEKQGLAFPEAKAWPLALASFQRVCASSWRSLELSKSCGLYLTRRASETDGEDSGPTPLGLRPYLGAMIWSMYQELPYLARMEFAREWALTLRHWDTDSLEEDTESFPSDWIAWRERVAIEFHGLLPVEKWKAIVRESLVAESMKEAARSVYSSAKLGENEAPVVDFVFHSVAASRSDREMLAEIVSAGNAGAWKTPVHAILSSSKGLYTVPGLARLSTGGISALQAKTLIWESCEAPTVQQVLAFPIVAQRILYVRSCSKPLEAGYASLMSSGIEGFASANPKVAFLQLQRAPTKLAFAKKILRGDLALTELMSKKSALVRAEERDTSYLGLRSAEWRSDVRAFKVLGAIEAVEWFRMGDEGGEAQTQEAAPVVDPSSAY